ncbi:MAG: YggT family protein [Gammaproteobacteria bacterium]
MKTTPSLFLFQLIFDFAIAIVMLRVMMQWASVNFQNPVAQFIARITNPLVTPLRKFIPSNEKFDLASIALAWAIAFIKAIVLLFLISSGMPNFFSLIFSAVIDIILVSLNVLLLAIILNAVYSLFPMVGPASVKDFLFLLTEPVLKPLRKLIPAVSGFDLSPVAVLIIIELVKYFFVNPLAKFFA